MKLSAADRAALRARASGLREEVSSLKADTTDALFDASEAQRDAALVAEVARLENAKAAAIDERDNARGSVEDAMAVMLATAEQNDIQVTLEAPAEAVTESADETTTEADEATTDEVVSEEPKVDETPHTNGALIVTDAPAETGKEA